MLRISMKVTCGILLRLGYWWHIADMTQLHVLLLFHCCVELPSTAVGVLRRVYAYTCSCTQTHLL